MVTRRQQRDNGCSSSNGNNGSDGDSSNTANNISGSCIKNDSSGSGSSDFSAFAAAQQHKQNKRKSDCNNKLLAIFRVTTLLYAICSLLTLAKAGIAVQGAAVYSNINFLSNPNFEQICNAQEEHFIESDGKESSLILEFTPGVLAEKRKSCTRILSAPSNYGFIVRLILPKIRHSRRNSAAAATASAPMVATATTSGSANTAAAAAGAAAATVINAANTVAPTNANIGSVGGSGASALNEMTSLIEKLNATALKATQQGRTCPLSIFSSLDPHTPQWRVDPCQLEDTAPEMEDPVRLFHGRVRIVWEHRHHTLHSKLMVTALGKGEQCRSENKHQCLKIGDEPILCISKELVCDGIRHCPYSNEYDSDEDYEMCWKRRRFDEPIPPAMETDIFEHFALEVFRNLFAFDVPTYSDAPTTADAGASTPALDAAVNSTTLRKVDLKPTTASANGTANSTTPAESTTESTGGHHRRNSTRSGLNSDLSKYGPWGYLMLGMLLCGGALLICGLWASASQHAANNEREAALQSGAAASGSDQQSGSGSPPNYDELDPPPAYSVLFPNQKAASSTTLSSLGAAALVPPTMAAVAVTAGSGVLAAAHAATAAAAATPTTPTTTAPTAASTTTTTTTTAATTCAQLETATCSSQLAQPQTVLQVSN